MIKEEEFKLTPSISPSDKNFREQIGQEYWEKIKSQTFRDNAFKCISCKFEPYDIEPDKVLSIHVEEVDEIELLNSKVRTICIFCHSIEHADVAIERGHVELVNSHFSQSELVNICRNGALSNHLSDGSIRRLKKSLPDFLEDLKSGKSKEGKVKLIFTDKFFKDTKINPA